VAKKRGKTGLKKRGTKWHCDFVHNGQRIRQSLETTDWREAEEEKKKLIAKVDRGEWHQASISGAREPFDKATDDYMTSRKLELAPASQAKERHLLTQPRAYFRQDPLKSITSKRIIAYRAWRAEQGVGPATLNAEIGVLRKILKRAKLWASVADDIKLLKEPESNGRALTPEERQRLLRTAAMKPEWETAYLASVIALNTTKRGGDLKGLQWQDIDLFGRTMTIRKSKTEASRRTIPLTAVACSVFARLRERAESFGPIQPEHYVFAAFVPKFKFSGKKVVDYGITGFDPSRPVKSWRTAWRTLTNKAGLPGFRFHDLRHTAITALAESGAPDLTIMSIAGHVSQKMLEKYSHIRMEAKRNAIEVLAQGTEMGSYGTNRVTSDPSVKTQPM
jgi:integrase